MLRRSLGNPALLHLPDDVDPRSGAGELGSDIDRYLDYSFVGAQLLGHVSAGHRDCQDGARLQGDSRSGPNDLFPGGQPRLRKCRCRQLDRRDVLLGDQGSGADLAGGDERLLTLLGAGAQHAECH